MMAFFISRAVVMIVGYIYPAYECFKSVEKNRPSVDQLRFWCQYWIIISILTVLERLGDTFISWVPMYNEAKLAFIFYLWYPKTKGTTYVYSTFLKPFVANHELEIDRNLNELKTRAGCLACHYWQTGSVYAQSRLMELLQYVAIQSNSSGPHQGSGMPQCYPPPPPPVYQPSSGYPLQPIRGYQPSAPDLPPSYQPKPFAPGSAGYESQPPPQGHTQQLPGLNKRPYYMNEDEAEYEVMDIADYQSVSEQVVNMPAQSAHTTRSWRRSCKQQ